MKQAVTATAMFCTAFIVAAAGASPGPGSTVSQASIAAPKDIAYPGAIVLTVDGTAYSDAAILSRLDDILAPRH
jgi:hypothetical protein